MHRVSARSSFFCRLWRNAQRKRAAMRPGSSGSHRLMSLLRRPWRSRESSSAVCIIVRPATATEALWAAEQALSSGVCAAVLLWLKGTDDRWLRRLKLAAEAGGALGVLFRPERHRFESSPAVLRLLLTQGEPEPRLELLKVQGGRPGPVEPEPWRLRTRLRDMPSRALESATADLFARPRPAPAEPSLHPRARRVPAPSPLRRRLPAALAAALSRCGMPWCSRGSRRSRGAAMLERLCLHAQRFTPLVSIEMPNALLLEIRGSVKLFGSLETLHAGIDAAWRHLELEVSQRHGPLDAGRAVAGTRRAARAHRGSRLARGPAGGAADWLHRLGCGALAELCVPSGVSRMGELLRLPRAGMARRFGAAAVLDLDIALTRQAAPRRAFVPRERFRERCDFETEVETAAYLEKALEPLVGRCARFLRERQAGVQASGTEAHSIARAPARACAWGSRASPASGGA